MIKAIDKKKYTELNKVKNILKLVPEEKQSFAKLIYDELEFMHKTMLQLKKHVADDGAITEYQNGNTRENPALKTYNTMISRYSNLVKQLVDLLPLSEVKAEDSLIDFINSQ